MAKDREVEFCNFCFTSVPIDKAQYTYHLFEKVCICDDCDESLPVCAKCGEKISQYETELNGNHKDCVS